MSVVGITFFLLNFILLTPALAAELPVNLLSASDFAILSKTGITNVPTSEITGNVGSSPISGTAILITCIEVTGSIYSTDASGPLPCRINDAILLTAAVSDMETAYTDAASRAIPDATELGAGEIGGMTLTAGLYKWSTDVTISTDLTLSGGAADVWIFQIDGDLEIASATEIVLAAGAIASNIFWQVAGPTGATLGTDSVFNGTILTAKQIIIQTDATLKGRALAQTQVTLDQAIVTNDEFSPAADADLNIIKIVDNVTTGTATSSDFMIYVKKAGSNVAGSPTEGEVSPGTTYTLSMGTYAVSEDSNPAYTESFSGDCDSEGNVSMAGDDKTCTITNTYQKPDNEDDGDDGHRPPSATRYGCKDLNATNYEQFVSSRPELCIYATGQSKTSAPLSITTPLATIDGTALIPGFPNTSAPDENENFTWSIIIIVGMSTILLGIIATVLRKHAA